VAAFWRGNALYRLVPLRFGPEWFIFSLSGILQFLQQIACESGQFALVWNLSHPLHKSLKEENRTQIVASEMRESGRSLKHCAGFGGSVKGRFLIPPLAFAKDPPQASPSVRDRTAPPLYVFLQCLCVGQYLFSLGPRVVGHAA
jgi:hypothetical protein